MTKVRGALITQTEYANEERVTSLRLRICSHEGLGVRCHSSPFLKLHELTSQSVETSQKQERRAAEGRHREIQETTPGACWSLLGPARRYHWPDRSDGHDGQEKQQRWPKFVINGSFF